MAEGARVAVDEILAFDPLLVYGYSDMTGDGRVGLWGGYGEYMEIFRAPGLHRSRTGFPPSSSTVFRAAGQRRQLGREVAGSGEGETVVIQGPGHAGLAVLEAVLARPPRRWWWSPVPRPTRLRLDAARAIGANHTSWGWISRRRARSSPT